MASNRTLPVVGGAMTEITLNDATRISAQNKSGGTLHLIPTVGQVEPTSIDGSIELEKGMAITGTLEELWPGVPGATRVYAWKKSAGLMLASHD